MSFLCWKDSNEAKGFMMIMGHRGINPGGLGIWYNPAKLRKVKICFISWPYFSFSVPSLVNTEFSGQVHWGPAKPGCKSLSATWELPTKLLILLYSSDLICKMEIIAYIFHSNGSQSVVLNYTISIIWDLVLNANS